MVPVSVRGAVLVLKETADAASVRITALPRDRPWCAGLIWADAPAAMTRSPKSVEPESSVSELPEPSNWMAAARVPLATPPTMVPAFVMLVKPCAITPAPAAPPLLLPPVIVPAFSMVL